eukprot:s13_g16.t1
MGGWIFRKAAVALLQAANSSPHYHDVFAPGDMQRMRSFETQEDLNTVRILVAGDAAVGKTRLCELICSGSCLGSGRVTDVPVLRESKEGPQQEKFDV